MLTGGIQDDQPNQVDTVSDLRVHPSKVRERKGDPKRRVEVGERAIAVTGIMLAPRAMLQEGMRLTGSPRYSLAS